uniref:4-coumarate--CoA ligase n=1 Tax=Aegilops tauschii subsp. strangulata TaxID=200361 RepID=A0A452YR64_AEGTS
MMRTHARETMAGCGLLKDTIKYKGFQIAPADLEAVLVQHPEIVDVAVTSAEDEEAGEIPVAFVVRRSGSRLTCVQVMEYVAKQCSPPVLTRCADGNAYSLT